MRSINGYGEQLYEYRFGKPNFVEREIIRQFLEEAYDETDGKNITPHFLITEWEQVVDAWQLTNWEEYPDVIRVGRKICLPESYREQLWDIFEKVRNRLNKKNSLRMHRYLPGLWNTTEKKVRFLLILPWWMKPRISV